MEENRTYPTNQSDAVEQTAQCASGDRDDKKADAQNRDAPAEQSGRRDVPPNPASFLAQATVYAGPQFFQNNSQLNSPPFIPLYEELVPASSILFHPDAEPLQNGANTVPAGHWQCLSCGSYVSETSKFCSGCGLPRSRYCPACGQPTRADKECCEKCGEKLP